MNSTARKVVPLVVSFTVPASYGFHLTDFTLHDHAVTCTAPGLRDIEAKPIEHD